MNKLLTLVSTLCFLSLPSAFAQVNGVNEINSAASRAGRPPQATCHNCRTDNSADADSIALPTTRTSRGTPYFNPACKSFIRDNGSYGPWGTIIKDYIVAKGGASSRFFADSLPGMESAPRTCPNWGRLSENEKMKFWVWMMASIAQVESSCNNRSVNTGRVPNPSDRPRGLLQLNTLRSERQWRGPNCRFPSGAEATYNASNNLKCGMDIMDELLKGSSGEYRANGKIFPTNSYWEKLRPNHSSNGGPIGRLVRRYPPCGATM
tara:strand:- start:7231 stop:8022 length:792 start_codon:yes stop_codon:yes gene_type:complete